MTMTEGCAIHGTRILDFSRVVAGPYCSQALSDLGAEIIKIENPKGGDDTRGYGPFGPDGESAYFHALNRNKSSVAIDLASTEGRDLAREMVKHVDVVLENFRTGVMERLGLGYDELKAINPRLIYCSISGYGDDGSLAQRAGYDPVIQAESGLMSCNGEPDGPALRTGIGFIDILTGMFSAQAILAALLVRERTGQGQRVGGALIDTGVAMLIQYGIGWLMTGEITQRMGNSSPSAQPIGVFQAADGPFFLTVAGNRVFRNLCQVIGRPDMADDPDFATNPARVENYVRLFAELNASFAKDTRDNWLTVMSASGVPAGSINDVAQALVQPIVAERQLVREVEHPRRGKSRLLAPPVTMHGTPVRKPDSPPDLGEHTEAMLRDMLGLDDDRLAALRQAGVIP